MVYLYYVQTQQRIVAHVLKLNEIKLQELQQM